MKRSISYCISLSLLVLLFSTTAFAGKCNMSYLQKLSAKAESISAQIQTLQAALQAAAQNKPAKEAALRALNDRQAAAKLRYSQVKNDKALRTQVQSELNGLTREIRALKKEISSLAKTVKSTPGKIAKLQKALTAVGPVIDTQAYYCYIESAGCEYGVSRTSVGSIPVGVCDRGNRVEDDKVWAYFELYFRNETEMGAFLNIVDQNQIVTFSGTNSQGYWQVNLKEAR